MKTRRFMAVAMAAVMCFAMFAGCAKKNNDGETIKIGFLGPLVGDLAQYGIAVQNGVKMYTEEINANGGINGKKVEVIYYDEKGDSVEALSAFNRLVTQDKVVAIIGDVTTTPTIAVAQESAKMENPIPMITASATADEVTSFGDNMFRSCFLDPFQGTTMANYASDILGAKKVAVIYDMGSDYSKGLAESFKETCEKNGVSIVAEESYATGDVDFRAQLTNIQKANPDVVFMPDYYQTVTLIVQQARQMGMQQAMLGCDGWDGVLGVTNDPSIFENTFFSNHYSSADEAELVQSFLSSYQKKFGEAPSAFAATAYDAAKVLCAAIEKVGTDSRAIIDEMKKTDLECVTGTITFDEKNNPEKTCAIITVKDGEYALDRKY